MNMVKEIGTLDKKSLSVGAILALGGIYLYKKVKTWKASKAEKVEAEDDSESEIEE